VDVLIVKVIAHTTVTEVASVAAIRMFCRRKKITS